jgi:type II secretory pathway component GspD/PulD (secretin)
MVAREKARTWLGIVVGLALTPAGVTVAGESVIILGKTLPSTECRVCQALPRPSRTQAALNEAIECYRRGEYEAAASLFRQVQSGSDNLTSVQQEDLTRFLQRNDMALQRRREASNLLRQAETAQREGQPQVAADILQRALANQYIAPADRQQALALDERLRSRQVAASGNDPIALARTKLHQARQLLEQGNCDAAEQLAQEAERLGSTLSPGEDSPRKVLEDVKRARSDPRVLLKEARLALQEGDLDRAEARALAAEKAEPVWSMHLWGDSPGKVLKEVRLARARASASRLSEKDSPRSGTLPATQPSAGSSAARPVEKEAPSLLDSFKGLFGNKKAESSPARADAGSTTGPNRKDILPGPDSAPQAAPKMRETVPAPDVSPRTGTAKIETARPPVTDNSSSPVRPAGSSATAARADVDTKEKKPTAEANSTQVVSNPRTAGTPAGSPRSPSLVDAARVNRDLEKARQFLQQGRSALRKGQLEQARECARQADALKAAFEWWDDNPARLLADVQRAETARGHDSRRDSTTAVVDAKTLLRKGREAYSAGKLDEAMQLAQKARLAPNAKWGLFDFDTPDKLTNDVIKSRTRRDQEEAGRQLAHGRQLLEKGDLEGASKAARTAQKLHGSYSLWDLGDRPDKLLDDIDNTRKKTRKVTVPPVPPLGQAVAQNNAGRTAPRSDNQGNDPRLQPSRLASGDRPGSGGLPAGRRESPTDTPPRPGTTMGPGKDQVATNPLPPLSSTGPLPVPPVPPPNRAPGTASSPDHAPRPTAPDQAHVLLAEARQLQKAGRLVEARTRALEAQRLSAGFAPNEDRPEKCLLELAGQARRQIDGLIGQADELVRIAPREPPALGRADAALAQARVLAQNFQLDCFLIDRKLTWVRQAQAQSAVALAPPQNPGGLLPADPAVVRTNVTDGGPQAQGRDLLAKVRMEIRAGNTNAARRLAEQIRQGPYALQAEADAMLRSIDAEEFEQRCREARRTFDAGNSAFLRRDYSHARLILQSLDPRMLENDQQARLRELMAVPEMQSADPSTGIARTSIPGSSAGTDSPGRASVSDDSREASFLQQAKAMHEVKFQKLRDEGFKSQEESARRFRSGETDRALEILQEYLSLVADTGLDSNSTSLLRRPVEARLQQYKTLKAQKDFAASQDQARQASRASRSQKELAEQNKQKRIQELMAQYNSLFKEAKYSDAEMYAMQALELDPDNATVAAAVNIAKMRGRLVRYNSIKDDKEKMVLEQLNDAETEGPVVTNREPIVFDKARWNVARKRTDPLNQIGGVRSEKEREIEQHLLAPVNMNFTDIPLGKVLDELSTWHGINIYPDRPALEEAGVSLDRPITIRLENISLKSALNLLLHQAHLTYVVADDVLKVTTKENARGRQQMRTFQVAELVIPLTDSSPSPGTQPPQASPAAPPTSPVPSPGTTPAVSPGMMSSSGTHVGSPGSSFATNVNNAAWSRTNAATREDQLIYLITNTIAPKSWANIGGQGTIDYFPLTMTLVINQTPDIQEQIADLLAALRRLQDCEVAVEIRLISIAEGFYERIGMDFNINIKNDHNTSKFEPMITSGQFKPTGYINDFSPSRFLAGLTPAGTFTSDLDIPIQTSSFGMAIPPFGGFPNIPGGNGGIELGLAFLSDIQVFLFMEAAQGDQRTNVMQAPKLTMFNGQNATLMVMDQQYFVTSVSVINNNGQITFVPTNAPMPTGGVTLSLQAVVSADRRFVRLNLTGITLTNLASAVIPLFPTPVVVTPSFEGGFTGQPVVFTQFLQQPVFNTISVSTSVAVPDGGTVLLGGLKRLSEGRNEFGPPILSKIPYINRLFKNVGYGREVQNLMMMVTPRIIINEEEEIKATGLERVSEAAPR